MYRVKQALNKKERDAILQLRFKVLREPWEQPIETATDSLEETSVNAFIEDENEKVIACGRLQENENKIGQIRYMAVEESYRGKGLGKLIMFFLEEKAKELHLHKIELQARENALQFYKSGNYHVREKSFLLWGKVQHYLMEKELNKGMV